MLYGLAFDLQASPPSRTMFASLSMHNVGVDALVFHHPHRQTVDREGIFFYTFAIIVTRYVRVGAQIQQASVFGGGRW